MTNKQRVLILCTGNSARSQMAEGWLRTRAGDRFDVYSAGSEPSSRVHPGAVRAMREIGIDISGHTPKSMAQFLDHEFSHVITVCDHAAEVCPVFPGKGTRHHRNFTDPAAAAPAEQQAVFRRVRDEIIKWLGGLFAVQ